MNDWENIFPLSASRRIRLPTDKINLVKDMIGKLISHYQIIEELGRGGMGIVYKAEDTKLHRTVALKFLPAQLTHDPEAKKRFIQEARAASALDHPNICTIHEIDDTADQQSYICMAYYDGETLKDRIDRAKQSTKKNIKISDIPVSSPKDEPVIPLDQVISISIQIAKGLAKAHQKGIVHRDIKPANIIITDEGLVKIVDFGLAKLSSETRSTQSGMAVGTLSFMSPEQVTGRKVDRRTDIFSFGSLVYQMLTGELPFSGDYPEAILYTIVHEEPEMSALSNFDVPEEVIRIINKALKKDPDQRYQSFEEILPLLFRLQGGRQSQPLFKNRLLTILKNPISYVFVFGLIISIILYQFIHKSTLKLSSSDLIVLADFENRTADSVFNNSLTEGMRVTLRQSAYLNILPQFKINETFQRMQLSSSHALDKRTALEVARREGAIFVLSADIVKIGSSYVLTNRIIEADHGEILKIQRVETPKIEGVLQAMDELALQTRNDLGESLDLISKSNKPLYKVTTPSLEALELYTRGIKQEAQGNYTEAIRLKEQAVHLDSTFTMAISSLSYNYLKVGNYSKALEYHNRVLPLLDKVTQREKYSILTLYYGPYFEGDYKKAFQFAEERVKQFPNDAVGYANLGHLAMMAGDFKTALQSNTQAVRLDSFLAGTCYDNSGFTFALAGQTDSAKYYFRQSKNIRPDYLTIDLYIAQVFWIEGKTDSAEFIFKSAGSQSDGILKARVHAHLAALYHYQGQLQKACQECYKGIQICKSEQREEDEAYFNYLLCQIFLSQNQPAEFYEHYQTALRLSKTPFWEVGLGCFELAAVNPAEALNQFYRLASQEHHDPLFKQRIADYKNLLAGKIASIERQPQKAINHFQKISKHYSGDPLYWLAQKEIAMNAMLAKDTTAITFAHALIQQRGEIIMAHLPSIRKGGFWTSELLNELPLEMGKYYLTQRDTVKAKMLFNDCTKRWQNADSNYAKALELQSIISHLH